MVYDGIIENHRDAIDKTERLDLVTQDMLIGQCGKLEQFHWFVRAHLENASGKLSTDGASTEKQAAKRTRSGR
jgi:starvation-inducible DNA-binding protein